MNAIDDLARITKIATAWRDMRRSCLDMMDAMIGTYPSSAYTEAQSILRWLGSTPEEFIRARHTPASAGVTRQGRDANGGSVERSEIARDGEAGTP